MMVWEIGKAIAELVLVGVLVICAAVAWSAVVSLFGIANDIRKIKETVAEIGKTVALDALARSTARALQEKAKLDKEPVERVEN